MSAFTKDEALAFVEAIRLNLEGKTGFKWFVERLGRLSDYIDATASENERLHAFLDSTGTLADYESYREGDPAEDASAPVQPTD